MRFIEKTEGWFDFLEKRRNEIKHKWINVGKKGTRKRIIWEKKFRGKKVYWELMSQFKSTEIKRDNKTLDFLKNLSKNEKAEATRKSSQKCLEFFSNNEAPIL